MSTVTSRNRFFSLRNAVLLISLNILSFGLYGHTSMISPTHSIYFNNVTDGGTIGTDQTICFGEDPEELLSSDPASGGDPSLPIEYLWMQSIPGVSGWVAISDATNPTYDPPPLNQTTAFIRCARRAGFDNFTAESNTVVITVQASPIVFITEAPADGNTDEVLTFSASSQPFVTYTWDFGDGTTAMGQTVMHSYAFGGTYTVTLFATDDFSGCVFPQAFEVFIIGALPVELEFFRGASLDDKSVELSWHTTKEINNHIFEIQKSVDGDRFEAIGAIDGQGNSDEGVDYYFIDDLPFLGINYYRLKQIDYSGDYVFTEVIAVHVDKEGADEYTLYPNPVSDILSIRFKDTYEHEVLVSIVDVNFHIVQQYLIAPHTLKSEFQIAELSAGIYSLNLYSQSIRSSKPFVKLGY